MYIKWKRTILIMKTMKSVKTENNRRRKRRVFGAVEKSRAVLSLWSERRTASELSEELSVSYTQLSQWQNLAMRGVLSALESKRDQEKPPLLSRRVETLLEKKLTGRNGSDRLTERLENARTTKPRKED